MKKKKIILFSIFAALLMLSMPAISSFQIQTLEKNEKKFLNSEKKVDYKEDCLLCGQSGENIYDLAKKIGITSKDIEKVEEKVLKQYKENIENFEEEPESSCVILLLSLIIKALWEFLKTILPLLSLLRPGCWISFLWAFSLVIVVEFFWPSNTPIDIEPPEWVVTLVEFLLIIPMGFAEITRCWWIQEPGYSI